MNRDSNKYTFLFATIMVVVVASALSITATSLKPLQNENVRKEKMQNILNTVGINVEREEAESYFKKHIIASLSLRSDGTIDEVRKAFAVELNIEIKKPIDIQRFPLYIAQLENEKFYIIPLRGVGLWDAIWGYIALNGDLNTVKGVIFDHKGETAGLGAEITKDWFKERFKNETIFEQNEFVGIAVQKGNNDPSNTDKTDHEVDAISGATITGDGVTMMIKERLKNYLPYFYKIKQL